MCLISKRRWQWRFPSARGAGLWSQSQRHGEEAAGCRVEGLDEPLGLRCGAGFLLSAAWGGRPQSHRSPHPPEKVRSCFVYC